MSDKFTCEHCGWTWSEGEEKSYLNHKRNSCYPKLDTESYLERYRRIHDELPDKYRDAYTDLTGGGTAPKTVQAAVCYIETDATLDEAGELFDKSAYAIRMMVNELIDRGVVSLEEVRANHCDERWQMFGEKRVYGEEAV